MKYLKKFESEIYVGTWQHYNALKPVNQKIFDEPKNYCYHCQDCNFDFCTENSSQEDCAVCLSKNISKEL